ncbi:MAG: hypothetical protein COW63_17045 [Bacteroidetes bacterium CG18_big_fil_WC_8_21_14_2_50_41_14]|nr:MAG: hypothetical protein COW63_17045 [Bacteroidetes bacterium CG18_big_fil_WC_8_21_14_2_50_41_14]
MSFPEPLVMIDEVKLASFEFDGALTSLPVRPLNSKVNICPHISELPNTSSIASIKVVSKFRFII